MSLFDQVSDGIIAAMKAREKEKLEALRNLKKVMLEARSNKGAGSELTDDESLKLIQKLVKQGRESAEIYSKQGRPDLMEQEISQVEVLEAFLPKPLSGEEITTVLEEIIKRLQPSSKREMGRIIGLASKELAGKASGQDIAARVKDLLADLP